MFFPEKIGSIFHGTHCIVGVFHSKMWEVKAVLMVICFHGNQVIGVPDERMGEELCAWVRLKAGQEATPEEIKGFCKGQVGWFTRRYQ